MKQTARIVIKAGREKSLRRRHPWVFSGAIERVDGDAGAGDAVSRGVVRGDAPPADAPSSDAPSGDAPSSDAPSGGAALGGAASRDAAAGFAAPGATVDVVDSRGAFLARGAYSPQSQIRARVWTFDDGEHVDAAFFRRRLEGAIELRRRLGMLEPDGACRLVFSESDRLPGLIVDRYGKFIVCQFLSAGADAWRDVLTEGLLELLRPAGIYERSEGAARRKEGLESRRGLLAGDEPPAELELASAGLRRIVRLGRGQKTGAYLDQQLNALRVGRYAERARVLDAFAYTGGFGMAALAHGAADATFVDSSAEALDGAAKEAVLNRLDARCRFVVGDVFEQLRSLKGQGGSFDLIVLDPPKFVHSASQIQSGSRGYKDVNLLALQLLAPGGTLATFSCSGHVDAALFQKIVAGAAVDAGRDAQILERLSQPPDHPIGLEFPEAEYLKGLILRVH